MKDKFGLADVMRSWVMQIRVCVMTAKLKTTLLPLSNTNAPSGCLYLRVSRMLILSFDPPTHAVPEGSQKAENNLPSNTFTESKKATPNLE